MTTSCCRDAHLPDLAVKKCCGAVNKNIDNKHNNKMLIEFYNTEDIKKQIEILFEVFKYLGKKIKKNQNEKKENKESEKNYIVNNTNLRFVSKWSDKLFLNYDGNKLMFSYYDENKREIYNKNTIDLKENIYSITVSSIKNNIFICYLNKRKIGIINLENKKNSCINLGLSNSSIISLIVFN